jgi:hypothetical protein
VLIIDKKVFPPDLTTLHCNPKLWRETCKFIVKTKRLGSIEH